MSNVVCNCSIIERFLKGSTSLGEFLETLTWYIICEGISTHYSVSSILRKHRSCSSFSAQSSANCYFLFSKWVSVCTSVWCVSNYEVGYQLADLDCGWVSCFIPFYSYMYISSYSSSFHQFLDVLDPRNLILLCFPGSNQFPWGCAPNPYPCVEISFVFFPFHSISFLKHCLNIIQFHQAEFEPRVHNKLFSRLPSFACFQMAHILKFIALFCASFNSPS